MKIRRVLFSISLCIVLITLNIIPVSAVDGTENIITSNLEYTGYVLDKNGDESDMDVSDKIIVSSYNNNYISYKFPLPVEDAQRLSVILSLVEEFDFNSSHEYSIKFKWRNLVSLYGNLQVCLFYYDSSGTKLKEQILYSFDSYDQSYNFVDFDFKPDTSDISGSYNCELVILYSQTGYNSTVIGQGVVISDEIEFIDKDDDSDWFAKIYYALLEHDDNVDAAVSQLENKLLSQLITLDSNVDSYIDTLDSHIKVYIENLGSDLLAAISSLDGNLARYIKTFQDTLIANDNSLFEALKEFLHNEMNPGVYEDPGKDDFQENKDEWDKIEGELPSFDSSDMHEVDITDYSGGFGAVRYLFDRFLSASGLTTLMSFSLMFGLGVFLIGRKVGG